MYIYIHTHFSSGITSIKPETLLSRLSACLLFLAAANLPWESAAPFGDTASSTPLEVRLNQILVATRVLLWFSTTPEVSLTALKNDGWKINLPFLMAYLQGRSVKLPSEYLLISHRRCPTESSNYLPRLPSPKGLGSKKHPLSTCPEKKLGLETHVIVLIEEILH